MLTGGKQENQEIATLKLFTVSRIESLWTIIH
jgi:hypothetical protein